MVKNMLKLFTALVLLAGGASASAVTYSFSGNYPETGQPYSSVHFIYSTDALITVDTIVPVSDMQLCWPPASASPCAWIEFVTDAFARGFTLRQDSQAIVFTTKWSGGYTSRYYYFPADTFTTPGRHLGDTDMLIPSTLVVQVPELSSFAGLVLGLPFLWVVVKRRARRQPLVGT